ncbi:MAG: histidine kinase dimerization/phospho-acceptor domain-containing protein, partial [Deltaproteobacteria bacterium]
MTSKLLLQLTVLTTALWIATATISRAVFLHEIEEISSDGLVNGAARLMPLVSNILRGHPETTGENEGEAHEAHELDEDLQVLQAGLGGFLAFEVRDLSGHVLLRSYDARDHHFPQVVRDGFAHEGNIYAYTLTNRAAGLILTVVEPDHHRSEAVTEATWAMFGPLLLLLPLMIGGILFVTRNATAPISDLRRQISARGGANFDPIETTSQPPELRPIANAVDRLLERLKVAMDAERAFAANSAHEMRTPLAGALAQTQRLRAELFDMKGVERVAEVEATLKRLSDFTEKLLQLSRADAGLGAQDVRENMTPIISLVVDDFLKSGRFAAGLEIDDQLQQ